MVNDIVEVANLYIDDPETIDRIHELLWDNLEVLITEDDRNYN